MKIGTIVNFHLNRERTDVLLSVFVPFVLMAESGYANGWVFAGGDLSLTNVNTYLSLLRGFALEALIYAMFKLTRILIVKRQWAMMLVPLVIGLVTMDVSAGLNLGWANRSGEMASMATMVGQFMPAFMLNTFKMGVGLIFPIAVGAFAFLDVGHLVDEMISMSAAMKERSLKVERAETHQNLLASEQKKSILALRPKYKDMAEVDAQNMFNLLKTGDYSFGLNELAKPAPQTSVKRIAAPAPQFSLPSGQAPITMPSFPAGPSMGDTQTINFPQPFAPPLPQQGYRSGSGNPKP